MITFYNQKKLILIALLINPFEKERERKDSRLKKTETFSFIFSIKLSKLKMISKGES